MTYSKNVKHRRGKVTATKQSPDISVNIIESERESVEESWNGESVTRDKSLHHNSVVSKLAKCDGGDLKLFVIILFVHFKQLGPIREYILFKK